MCILLLISNVFYRRSDVATNIAISLLANLIYNPFYILNAGLQLSYMGTVGIIVFATPISKQISKIKLKKSKIISKDTQKKSKIKKELIQIISVILSAQLFLLPLILFHFYQINIYYLLTNLLISIVIGPVYVVSLMYMICNIPLIKCILEFGISIIIWISEFSNNLVGSKIYLPIPNVAQIIVYYIFIFIFLYVMSLKQKDKPTPTQKRILNLIELFKFRFRQISKRKKKVAISIIIICCITFKVMPKSLKINFLDVGQGDSTFIITPYDKTVLIDRRTAA